MDQPEFETWAREDSPRLLRLAYLLCGNTPDAQDLVQATFERLFVARRRLAAADDRGAYARRAMLNAHASRHRRRRREVYVASPPDVGAEATGFGRVDDRSRLGAALAQLPPKQRAVVVLRYLEDLSERETADLLGCSLGTVKSHASRGLAALRTQAPALAEGETHG